MSKTYTRGTCPVCGTEQPIKFVGDEGDNTNDAGNYEVQKHLSPSKPEQKCPGCGQAPDTLISK